MSSSRKRKHVHRVDPDFEYHWHPPAEKIEFKEEEHHVDKGFPEEVQGFPEEIQGFPGEIRGFPEAIHDGGSLPKKFKGEEIVDEEDFQEAKEEAERPKLTWPQIIDEALKGAEDKRLPVGEVFSCIAQSYPYFTKNAERWEKARKVIKDTFSKYGYKKVQGNEDEECFWALRDYEGPDIIHDGGAMSKFAFCKKCCNPMKHANLAKHELVCGTHIMMLGKVCFCRSCGQTFTYADIEQHGVQCFVEDKELDGNLQLYNVRRVYNFWRRFRNEKRRTMSMTCPADDINSVEASDLVQEFKQWHGPKWSQWKNPPEAEDVTDPEEMEQILWPKFLQYWKKKNNEDSGLMVNDHNIDMEGIEFKQWLQRRKQRKREREKSLTKLKICGKCGKSFKGNFIMKRHEEKCEFIQAREALCEEDHEHQYIDKAFDTLDEAIAFFYDNEYDSEFCRRSSNVNTKKRRRLHNHVYINNVCVRSAGSSSRAYVGKLGKSKKLNHKCPAYITIVENSPRTSGEKTTVTGCLTHNHVDNHTMKRVSWLAKRRIAKYLLLGHSKKEIHRDLLPQYHVDGQKKVGLGDVWRISKLLNSGKAHKLRQGLDAISLVAKDDQESCLRGVYPWPPDDNPSGNLATTAKKSHLVPQQNQIVPVNLSSTIRIESQISPMENERSYDETDHAVASIVEITANGEQDTSLEAVPEAEDSTDHSVADDAVDPDAFQVMRSKVARELTSLSERVLGLPASGAGIAELQSILRPSLFDLVMPRPAPRPPAKPESVKRRMQRQKQVREGRLVKPQKKQVWKPVRISDEEWAAKMSEV